MPFLDHLEELRWRVLYSLLAIVIGTLVGWFIVERVDVIGLLIRPIAPLLPDGKLKFTNPTEPFFITLKFAFALGVLLASPIIGYQTWAFLAPALYERERRLVIPALSVGVLLFLAGASAAYFWVLPRALQVLFSFQRNVFEPIITADHYFGFAAQLILAFGLMTELPLVVVILAALGLVTPQFLSPEPAVRDRAVRGRRGAALAAGRRLDGRDDGSALAAVRSEHLLRMGRHQTGEGTRPRGYRARGFPPTRSRNLRPPLRTGGTGRSGHGDPASDFPRWTVSGRAHRYGDGAEAWSPNRADPHLSCDGRSDGFPARAQGLSRHAIRGGYADRHRRQPDHLPAGAGVSRSRRNEVGGGLGPLPRGQLPARCDRGPQAVRAGHRDGGESMRYDTCLRRGTVHRALTDFRQGGATWYMRGDLAVDSGSTRMYGASTDITSDDHPLPDYHFATGQIKWLNKSVMVARPAVLYVHDVPILWLPFIFQDVRPGRRSGMLSPRLGVNDLVRPTRSYQRHFANLGYFIAVNDYLDVLASADWYSGRNLTVRAQSRYRWLDRFIDGSLTYARVDELDSPVSSSQIGWQHVQSFDSRTRFNASINYATSGTVLQRNSVDPFLATASLASQVNFDKRFGWGTFNIGGSRSQDLSGGQVSQVFPRLSLTPSPVNITPSITWSPGFSYTNQQAFHSAEVLLPIVGAGGVADTLALFAHTRQTSIAVQTPLRIGRWNWDNAVTVNDATGNQRQALAIADSTVPGGRRRVLYGSTFATSLDWQTGINLPQLFGGTWKLQPGMQIVNTTSAGPFRLRNQFTGGEWVQQGKRVQLSLGIRPAFFGFFPGLGPVARIRHSISPIIDYRYAPGGHVPDAFARAIDPGGITLNARTDPQQTISIGLSQNFEAKLRPARGDTSQAPPRKLRILSINTDGIAYNFEQAKQPNRVGWQTQTIGNTFASDLLPNFSLRVVHDLWDGPVGHDSSRFSPFLQSVNASFAVTPATLRGLAGLLGLRHHRGLTPTSASAPLGTADQPSLSQPPPPVFGGPRSVYGPPGGGQGFSLNLSLTINRTRPIATLPAVVTVPIQAGQQQLNMNLSFRPTDKWQANWTTAYDLVSKQFGEHYVRLERDLHRWRATFSFAKSSNGNFAFSFAVSLLDEPDIKFDYEQQTLQ